MKPFLFIYLISFYGIAFFWRSYRTWQETGINPYKLDKQKGVHGFLATCYQLLSIGVAGTILIYVFAGNLYDYLTPIQWLIHPAITTVGMALLLVSFAWIIIAQRQMGRSWRIGIDSEHKTDLVTQGVFSISRNPIFLGMRLNLAGLFFVLPSAVTLTTWLLGDVLLQIQVHIEEDHLKQLHGDTYTQYTHQVRRWL